MAELSLDLNPSSAPQSINLFLKEVSRLSNVSDKFSKVDGYVRSLEEEMKKIDAFKRELPLCMLLLNDAIRTLKFERMQFKALSSDFGCGSKGLENDLREKKNWMSSVQLWTLNGYSKADEKHKGVAVEEVTKQDGRSTNNVFARNGGGAFLPFKGPPSFLANKEQKDKNVQEEPALSLVTPGMKRPRPETTSGLMGSKVFVGGLGVPSLSTEITQPSLSLRTPTQSHASRKQRRCWSPELHKLFLNALHQLGGSQVATPKQIRELMKVDGLTNDEVKSHLQKYRLHTRRYPASANAVAPDNQKLVLFGGLWVPQDQCGTSKTSTSESESPQGPLQLMGTSGGTSTTGGDSMEEEEDEKSESCTWKGQFYKPGEDEA